MGETKRTIESFICLVDTSPDAWYRVTVHVTVHLRATLFDIPKRIRTSQTVSLYICITNSDCYSFNLILLLGSRCKIIPSCVEVNPSVKLCAPWSVVFLELLDILSYVFERQSSANRGSTVGHHPDVLPDSHKVFMRFDPSSLRFDLFFPDPFLPYYGFRPR